MENVIEKALGEYYIEIGVDGSDQSDDIKLTEKALKMMKFIREENGVPDEFLLRLAAHGGGCSGMKYELTFDSEINESDRVYELGGLKFLVSSHNLFYMMGMTIDYTEGLQGSGFIFNSPNDLPSCGGCKAFN